MDKSKDSIKIYLESNIQYESIDDINIIDTVVALMDNGKTPNEVSDIMSDKMIWNDRKYSILCQAYALLRMKFGDV